MFADLAFLQRKRQRDERKNVRIKKQYVIRVRDEEYSLIVTKQCKKKVFIEYFLLVEQDIFLQND